MGIISFVKEWTLPLAMGTGAAAYGVFAFTPQLDEAGRAMAPLFAAILPLFMFLVLFVTFCKVDFRQLRPVGWHVWVGVFQLLLIGVLMALAVGFRMSGCLTFEEASFYSVLMTFSLIWCAFLVFVGLMEIHDYGCGCGDTETGRLAGADDDLYVYLELHHGTGGTRLLPDDREVG